MRAGARVVLRGDGVVLSGPWMARARDSVLDDWMERQRNPVAPQRNAQESMSFLSSNGPIFVFSTRPSAETSTE